MNLKLRRGKVIHYRGVDYPDELYPDSEKFYSQRNDAVWSHWALCGAAGTRRLKPTNEPVTCKSCLRLAQMKREAWKS